MPYVEKAHRLPSNLEPEQRQVRDRIISQARGWEVIAVQGVAGSGKTTVALHALRSLVQGLAIDGPEAVTPVYITQNPRLVGAGHGLMRAEVGDRVAPPGTVHPGRVNVLTTAEVFSLLGQPGSAQEVVSDEEAQRDIAEFMARSREQDPTRLLPSQVYAIIVSFLKGRRDLRHATPEDLPRLVERLPDGNHTASIEDVRRLYFSQYKKALATRWDRADLAWHLHRQLEAADELFEAAEQALSCADPRPSRRQRKRCEAALDWVEGYLECMTRHGEVKPDDRRQARAYLDHLRSPSGHRTADNPAARRQLADDLGRWVSVYGMLNTPVLERVGARLQNPVFIVDEVQDLSEVERGVLLRLYFHLTRRPRRSRLVLLGDVNQQVLPTGFRWEDLFEHLTHLARRFRYDDDRFCRTTRLEDAEGDTADRLGPYLLLRNNYRTSAEIALFARDLGRALADHLFGPAPGNDKDRYVDRLIDPASTQIFNAEMNRDYNSVPDEYKKPQVVVADRQTVIEAVRMYRGAPGGDAGHGLVFITQDAAQLEDVLGAEGKGIYCYTPQNCKGLEFRGSSVLDLPRKETATGPDEDVVAQWYCAVTRARVLLVVFLTPGEAEYLGRYGWPVEKMSGCAQVRGVPGGATVEECLAVLRQAQTTMEPTPELAERYLLDFLRYLTPWRLERAVEIYEALGEAPKAETARRRAAQAFEERHAFEQARTQYRSVGDLGAVARCYRAEVERMRAAGKSAAADALAGEAREFAGREEQARSVCAGEIWHALGEHARAVRAYLRHGDTPDNLRLAESEALHIKDPVSQRTTLAELAARYRRLGPDWLPEAYALLHRLHDLPACDDVVRQMTTARRYDLLRRAYSRVHDTHALGELASRLQGGGEFEQAGACYALAGDLTQATTCWLNAAQGLFNDVDAHCPRAARVAAPVVVKWVGELLVRVEDRVPADAVTEFAQLEEVLARIRTGIGAAGETADAPGLRRELVALARWYFDRVVDGAELLWNRSEGSREALGRAYWFETEVWEWYDKHLKTEHGRLRPRPKAPSQVQRKVDALWDHGDHEKMITAACCWDTVQGPRNKLRSRLTKTPGVVTVSRRNEPVPSDSPDTVPRRIDPRTSRARRRHFYSRYESEQSRTRETRVLGIERWADLMLELDRRFGYLDAGWTAQRALVGLVRLGGDKATEAARVLRSRFGAAALPPTPDDSDPVARLLARLSRTTARDAVLRARKGEIIMLLRMVAQDRQQGKLTTGSASWRLLCECLTDSAGREVRELVQECERVLNDAK